MEELLLYLGLDEIMTFISLSFGILTPLFLIGYVRTGRVVRTPIFTMEFSTKINPILIERLPFIPVRFHSHTIRSSLEGESEDRALFFPTHH